MHSQYKLKLRLQTEYQNSNICENVAITITMQQIDVSQAFRAYLNVTEYRSRQIKNEKLTFFSTDEIREGEDDMRCEINGRTAGG